VTTVDDLQALVDARYRQLDLPRWPDPHQGMASPREEEYSRLTDPGRYRVVHARVHSWVAVLEEVLGPRVEVLDGAFDRGVRLVPVAADALPLVLVERDLPLAAVDIAIAAPDLIVDREPDCGCDACDSGSDLLLEAIDQTISQVVRGPYVVLRGPGWQSQWHPDGGGAGGEGRPRPDFGTLMDLSRRLAAGDRVDLPAHTDVLVGQSWIG